MSHLIGAMYSSLLVIREAVRWRLSVYNDTQASFLAELKIKLRWRFRKLAVPSALAAPLIVSLTSYPARYHTLSLTIKCLLSQTVKADQVILWIAEEHFETLPISVLSLKSFGLEIKKCNDLRSYKKILPALDAYPGSFICTADDDVYYHETWLAELIAGLSVGSLSIACHRAYEIKFNRNGMMLPYGDWKLAYAKGQPGRRLFPTGVGGVLYSPGTLAHTAQERLSALSICPHADDVWLFWIGRRNKSTYRLVPGTFRLICWKNSQQAALWRANVFKNQNDQQIENVCLTMGPFC